MDSAVINKLIRSEIWPLLQAQGFTQFEARRARRFGAWRTDVVEFHSFTALAAGEYGITSFSLSVHCGVFLTGGVEERWLKSDRYGRALPNDTYCTYRALLLKREPFDGLRAMEIFFIDPDGRTLAPVFQELRFLLSKVAPQWFSGYDQLDRLIGRLDGTVPIPDVDGPGLRQIQGPNAASLVGEGLLARLTRANGGTGTVHLERAAGHALSFPPILSSADNVEECLLHLWPEWNAPEQANPPVPDEERPKRKDLSGLLPLRKGHELVVITPADKGLRRRASLPESAFYVGIGVYWPELEQPAVANPTFAQCHVLYWLIPRHVYSTRARLAFVNVEDARGALLEQGSQWLGMMRDPSRLLALLEQSDLAILKAYPTTRGIGERHSLRREMLTEAIAARMNTVSGPCKARKLRGKLRWKGDLDAMRTDR